MTTFTDRARSHDLVKTESPDQRYTRAAGTIQNKTGVTIAAGAVGVGSPLNKNGTQWETVDSGSESTADGLLVDDRIVPSLANNAITDEEYQILINGPAEVNLDAVPDDPDGTTGAYDLAALETRLLALVPPIKCLREPETIEIQET